MKKRALFVGVDKYVDCKNINRLNYAFKDANALNVYFAQHGFAVDDLKLLPNPTRDELVSEYEKIIEDLGPGDCFVFYFAGHAITRGTNDQLLICTNDTFENISANYSNVGVLFSELHARAYKKRLQPYFYFRCLPFATFK